tara:strand:- start:378 stop:992 length:615 start_codon:yes stop_codon:yes gene_type:complete
MDTASNFLILVFGGKNSDNVTTKVQLHPNPSMQVGDTVYKITSPGIVGGITTADSGGSSTLVKIGEIKQIHDWNNGNGAGSGNYGNINGDTTSSIAAAIFPIDLDGDGNNEVGDSNVYWSNNSNISWEGNEFQTSGYGSYAVVIDNNCCTSVTLTTDDYYFFAKDNSVNASSMTGYYGEVEFKNNSTKKAELFSTACDIVESSK